MHSTTNATLSLNSCSASAPPTYHYSFYVPQANGTQHHPPKPASNQGLLRFIEDTRAEHRRQDTLIMNNNNHDVNVLADSLSEDSLDEESNDSSSLLDGEPTLYEEQIDAKALEEAWNGEVASSRTCLSSHKSDAKRDPNADEYSQQRNGVNDENTTKDNTEDSGDSTEYEAHLLTLPAEVLVHLLSFLLDEIEAELNLLTLAHTCYQFRSFLRSPAASILWKQRCRFLLPFCLIKNDERLSRIAHELYPPSATVAMLTAQRQKQQRRALKMQSRPSTNTNNSETFSSFALFESVQHTPASAFWQSERALASVTALLRGSSTAITSPSTPPRKSDTPTNPASLPPVLPRTTTPPKPTLRSLFEHYQAKGKPEEEEELTAIDWMSECLYLHGLEIRTNSLRETVQQRRQLINKWQNFLHPDPTVQRWKVKLDPRVCLEMVLASGIPNTLRGQAWDMFADLGPSVVSSEYALALAKVPDVTPLLYRELLEKYEQMMEEAGGVDNNYARITYAAIRSACTYYQANYQTDSLRKVLLAYAALDDRVGYNHKMLHIASVLLIFLPEEEAFKLLVKIMYSPKYSMRKMFLVKQAGIERFRKLLPALVQQLLPRLWYTENRHHVVRTICGSTSWAYGLFSATNLQLSLRIWDLFMVDGYNAILVVAICILSVLEERLCRKEQNEAFDLVLLEDPEFGRPEFIDKFMLAVAAKRKKIIKKLRKLE